MRRLVVGITGASGSIYGDPPPRGAAHGRRHRDAPRDQQPRASAPSLEETDYPLKAVEALAHVVYDDRDIGASLASGSFKTMGMAVAPCSIKTVSALANELRGHPHRPGG